MILEPDGIYARLRKVFSWIQSGHLGEDVLSELVVDDVAISDEAVLWDYKQRLPRLPLGVKPSDSLKETHNVAMQEIVKDAVAFYNSYGGYLVIGVNDDRVALGYADEFDVSDLNKRIHGAVGHTVACSYRVFKYRTKESAVIDLGLLFIPRRANNETPAQFRKNSSSRPNGSLIYRAREFYIRDLDQCRPAESTEDFEFLFSPNKRSVIADIPELSPPLQNNLVVRDFELGRLIGRQAEIAALWSWLADPLSPIRLVWGLGGVGKTSLVYTFAERLIFGAPGSFEKLIWLSAKQRTFSALKNEFVDTIRSDFLDIETFLMALLLELGFPSQQLDPDWGREELVEQVIHHLEAFSSVVVVDDVDTLKSEEQQEIFHLILQIFARARSKAIMTARLSLGAPATQFIEVRGLPLPDFAEFVREKVSILRLPGKIAAADNVAKLHELTDGSPMFALSVLRLVSLGDDFEQALKFWKGADGNDVRRAAFEREVQRLTVDEARVLLCCAYLSTTPVPVVATILEITRFQIQKALDRLLQFSMIAFDAEDGRDGMAVTVPQTVSLMIDVLEKKVPEFSLVRDRCKAQLDLVANSRQFVSDTISRSFSAAREGNHELALSMVTAALGKLPEHPDLHCVQGRLFFHRGPDFYGQGEEAFKRAEELGCQRRELYDYWLRLKQEMRDWEGIVALGRVAQKKQSDPDYCLVRTRAFTNLGDAAVSASLPKAEQIYLDGLVDIRSVFRDYGDFTGSKNLRDAQRVLVHRWMGVVRTLSEREGNPKRLFNACFHGFSTYRMRDEGLIMLGAEALAAAAGDLPKRKFSEPVLKSFVEDVGRLENMIKQLEQENRGGQTTLAKRLAQLRNSVTVRIAVYETTRPPKSGGSKTATRS